MAFIFKTTEEFSESLVGKVPDVSKKRMKFPLYALKEHKDAFFVSKFEEATGRKLKLNSIKCNVGKYAKKLDFHISVNQVYVNGMPDILIIRLDWDKIIDDKRGRLFNIPKQVRGAKKHNQEKAKENGQQ